MENIDLSKVVCVQDICNIMEDYKRELGRRHSETYSHKSAYSTTLRKMYRERYNDVEDGIRYLVKEFDCTRTSKPYYLSSKTDNR